MEICEARWATGVPGTLRHIKTSRIKSSEQRIKAPLKGLAPAPVERSRVEKYSDMPLGVRPPYLRAAITLIFGQGQIRQKFLLPRSYDRRCGGASLMSAGRAAPRHGMGGEIDMKFCPWWVGNVREPQGSHVALRRNNLRVVRCGYISGAKHRTARPLNRLNG